MIIGLTGNDGSGKTTIANKLERYYLSKGKSVIKPHEFEYFFIMRVVKKMISSSNLTKQQKVLQDSNKSTVTKTLIPYIVYIDLFFEYWFRKFFQKNKIIIKDRTPYDFLATWTEQNVSNKFIHFIYNKLPQVDIHFYIDTNTDIAYQRRVRQNEKQEKDKIFYKNKHHIYSKIIANINNKIVVNNNNALNQAVDLMIQQLEMKDKIKNIKTIAISGLDGAGKTTTINNLEKELQSLNIKYKTIHFYYNYSFLKLKRLFIKDKPVSEKESHKKSIENENKAVQKGKPQWWKWFVFGDAYLQYLFVKIFYRNQLVIFDRFFPDYLVSFDFLGVRYDKQKMFKFFPRVDRYFLQIADYNILYNRKPEHTMDFFKKCHSEYITLARKYDMIVLDSGKYNEKEVVKKLLQKI